MNGLLIVRFNPGAYDWQQSGLRTMSLPYNALKTKGEM